MTHKDAMNHLPADLRAVLPDGRSGLNPIELDQIGRVLSAAWRVPDHPMPKMERWRALSDATNAGEHTIRALLRGRQGSRDLALRVADALDQVEAVEAILRGVPTVFNLVDAAGFVWRLERGEHLDGDTPEPI